VIWTLETSLDTSFLRNFGPLLEAFKRYGLNHFLVKTMKALTYNGKKTFTIYKAEPAIPCWGAFRVDVSYSHLEAI